jgi:hypothetical protein
MLSRIEAVTVPQSFSEGIVGGIFAIGETTTRMKISFRKEKKTRPVRTRTPCAHAHVRTRYFKRLDSHSSVYFTGKKRGVSYGTWLHDQVHDVVYQFASCSKRRQKCVRGGTRFDVGGMVDVRTPDHAVGWRALEELLESRPGQAERQRAASNATSLSSQHVMINLPFGY